MGNMTESQKIVTLAAFLVTMLAIINLIFDLERVQEDHADTRKLVAELLDHEVVQAQMLCDKGVSEAEGCEDDG